MLATVSLNSITNNSICNEFLDIQTQEDGITVPEIHKWIPSTSSYGFLFHAWICLDDVKEWKSDPYIDSTRYRRVLFR